MYFSLIPTPGYNLSYLEACGVEGEWELFQGDILETEDTDRIGWNWGGTNCSIAGISWTLWQFSPLPLVELQRDSYCCYPSNLMPLYLPLWHKNSWILFTERRPCATQNQRGGFWFFVAKHCWRSNSSALW